MLDGIIKTANFFRNVCAHEERLYNFKINEPARSTGISTVLKIPVLQLDKGNLFSMFSFLKLGLSKEEHKSLQEKLKALFKTYSSGFFVANFNDILIEMGFTSNWESYFN